MKATLATVADCELAGPNWSAARPVAQVVITKLAQRANQILAALSAKPPSDLVEHDDAEASSLAGQSENAATAAHAAESSFLTEHGQVNAALRKTEPSAEDHTASPRAGELPQHVQVEAVRPVGIYPCENPFAGGRVQ